MKIYTSYYGNVAKLRKAGIRPIGISRGVPKSFFDFNMFDLAPRWDMLKMSESDYCKEFAKILADRNPLQILKQIETIANGSDVALLCYEKPGEFCHRRLVAEWIRQETGVCVDEYEAPEPVKRKKKTDTQQSLF